MSICKGSTLTGASFFCGAATPRAFAGSAMRAGRCGHRPLRNDLQGGTHVSRCKRHILSGGARGPRPTGRASFGRTESSAPTDGTSRTAHHTARSAVIARSEATRQSVLPLPPSAREVAARSADGGRAVIRFCSPPVGCADSPLPEGALQRGSAALTGRRTPRAFVPLRSTAGRRPLRSGLPHPSVGRAKFFAKPETFPGRWVYDI